MFLQFMNCEASINAGAVMDEVGGFKQNPFDLLEPAMCVFAGPCGPAE